MTTAGRRRKSVAKRPRSLFLYLTLICFLGLIAIFVVDGYMGTYDTIYVTTGEREQTVEADTRLRQDWLWSTGVGRDEKVIFRYEIDNRRFSSYTANIEVSLWRMQEKIQDIISQPITVGAFAKEQVVWVLDSADILPADIPPERTYEYTVVIKNGEIERRLIISINPVLYLPKAPIAIPIPVPAR